MRDGKKMTTKNIWKRCEKVTINDRSRKEEKMFWREWERKGKL